MKTRNIFVSLLMVMLCTLCVEQMFAITFVQGDQIFIEANQDNNDGGSWVPSGSQKLYIYIWNGTGENWVQLTKDNGTVYGATMPTGTWADQFIIVRSTDGGWGGKDRQTANLSWRKTYTDKGKEYLISFPEKNCLKIFKTKGKNDETYTDWIKYSPVAASIPKVSALTSGIVSEEKASICPNALGGPYSLRVKLTADKKAYDYDAVTCHAWYRSVNGNTWEAIDSYVGTKRDDEMEKDIITNNLPAPASLSSGYIYYYLYSANASGRRLIKLTTDASDCDLDCTITFFGVACSEVNANDTTYTLDGMIAFGEPCGDLVITCDGKEARIKASEAHSPQTFSIPGLKAATQSGTTTTAVAKFTGDSRSRLVTVNIPNATQGITYKHIDLLVGETTPLTPSVTPNYDNKHIWYIDGEEQTSMQGQQSSTASNEPNTTKYTYREFNPPAGDMSDMMSNGSYEDEFDYGTQGQKSTISDYNFWGKYAQTDATSIDFYTNTTVNPNKWSDNGFAVVKNANNFFYTFAKVKARDGSYLALFDAASDGVSGKKAWKAETAKNPNLKLQKGTTYLFSFWAANINNYGEMDNAAKLQFQIEYNGKTQKLGDVLDLGSSEFRNNRWHQCSATFYADADASNVTISVVNLNTNKLNTGNDFALDDIQFRAVSSATRSVRIQQVFEVQTHEPVITDFTATPVQMNCDGNEYNVKLHIEYQNQIGKIIVKDITGGANRTVWTKDLTPLANGSDKWDKTQTLDHTVKQTIAAGDPLAKERKYKVYFEKWTNATKSVIFNDPVVPMMQVTYYNNPDSVLPCGQKTYSISGTVTYRNMNAKAYAWIDSDAKVEITGLTQSSSNERTAIFTVPNVPADSAEHVLHVAFEGRGTTCPFEDTFRAAFAPVLDDVQFIGVPAALHCDSDNYAPQVQVRTSNHRNAVLTVEFEGQTPAKESRVVTADITTFDYPAHPVDGGTYSVKVYFDYVHNTFTDCEKSASFTAPIFTKCPEVMTLTAVAQPMECDETSYDVMVTVEYLNPSGNLIIHDVTAGKNVYEKPVPDAGTLNEPQTNSDITFRVNGLEPAEHEFKAYFADWTKSATDTTMAPEFTKCCTDGLIFHKWINVLFVNNGDSSFVAYQWYKNDMKMDGDTLQYLYTRRDTLAGTSDLYHCVVTLRDGSELILCGDTFDSFPSSAEASQQVSAASVMVRPTRLPAGNAVTITKTDDETMQATLFTVTGQIISVTCLSNDVSTMLMPDAAGMYLLKIQGTNTQSTVKINVF